MPSVRNLSSLAFVLAFSPIVGDFFVTMAESLGLYGRPVQWVLGVLDSITSLPFYSHLVVLLGGIAAGARANHFSIRSKRAAERKAVNASEVNASTASREAVAGFLHGSPGEQVQTKNEQNRFLQDEVKGARTNIENPRPTVIVSNVKVARIDDVTSRHYLTYAVERSGGSIAVCLDLMCGIMECAQPNPFRWSKKTRHVLEIIEQPVPGQTKCLRVMDDVGDLPLERNAPAWFVGNSDPTGFLSPPPNFHKAAIVFVQNGYEQEHRMVILPREVNEAFCVIDADLFSGKDFWDNQSRHVTVREARGERQVAKKR